MLVAVVFRRHFRRSMGFVYLHHVLCATGVLFFVYPSPPRGFFLYIWGEALTACRVLPPASRWRARSAAFAFRRASSRLREMASEEYLQAHWEEHAERYRDHGTSILRYVGATHPDGGIAQ